MTLRQHGSVLFAPTRTTRFATTSVTVGDIAPTKLSSDGQVDAAGCRSVSLIFR
jgi:hypothetical protein